MAGRRNDAGPGRPKHSIDHDLPNEQAEEVALARQIREALDRAREKRAWGQFRLEALFEAGMIRIVRSSFEETIKLPAHTLR